jgi:hypothetical protein
MTIGRLIDTATQYFSRLYSREWETWELMTIAIVALVLLSVIGGAWRKVRASAKRIRKRAPIVGVNLANRKRRRQGAKRWKAEESDEDNGAVREVA